jgi:crotonobetainyl-CoA:carnitine CoA-transferase CaiB-like acyl-CoA transferase
MCGMMLADLGAEVFVIQRTGVQSAEARMHVKNRDMINRGKHMLALDLKDPSGLELVLDLVSRCNGLLESFRPGVMERLGIGPEVCLKRNPSLVYTRLTGWGQTGPLAMAAGHDPNYVALTGALYHSGGADMPPQSPPTLLGDAAGGAAMTALGMCAALIPAVQNGQGQVIDAAIGEGTAYLTTLVRSFYNTGQLNDARGTSWMEGASPWGRSYRCADDRYVTLLPVEARFYAVLLEKLELADDPVFAGRKQFDQQFWSEQADRMERLFASRSRDEWCDLLEGTDACFAPVLTYGEAPHHPHNIARGNYVEADGDYFPSPAPRFSVTPHEPDWLGTLETSSREALLKLGIESEKIDSMMVDWTGV